MPTTADTGGVDTPPIPDRVPVTLVGGSGPDLRARAAASLGDDRPGSPIVMTDDRWAGEVPAPAAVHLDAEEVFRDGTCRRCAVRLDVIRTFALVAGVRRPPSRVLLASGGDPMILAQTFLVDPDLYRHGHIDQVVFAVDAVAVATQLAVHNRMSWERAALDHLCMADVIVVLGDDRLTARARRRVVDALATHNPLATVVCGTAGSGPALLKCRATTASPGGRDAARPMRTRTEICRVRGDHGFLRASLPGPLDRDRLDTWLGGLVAGEDGEVLRLRAWLTVAGEAQPWVVQGVGGALDIDDPPAGERRAAGDREINCHLEVVGRGVQPDDLLERLRRCRP